MKKLLLALAVLLTLTACTSTNTAVETEPAETTTPEATEEVVTADLPAPQDTAKEYKANAEDETTTPCTAGVYGIDCSSITADNLTEYLGRTDVLYIDLRDYADYAKSHLRNFEVVPYFAAIMGEESQLYSGTPEEPVARYEESDELLEAFFPKDTTIFLMCQSGGRVAQLMKLLEVKGYDMSRIYNVGGMAQYGISEYTALTTQTSELVVDATYTFEGLTLAE